MAKNVAAYEAQLEAMRVVMQALQPLDEDEREAVFAWVESQLGRRKAPVTSRGAASHADAPNAHPAASRREGTVSVVAQKIGAKSARDLLLAAATHLMLYQGRETFSKEELIACAKEARGWKAAYSNQMAFNITRMIKAGTLFEKAKDVFSLSEASEAEMQGKVLG